MARLTGGPITEFFSVRLAMTFLTGWICEIKDFNAFPPGCTTGAPLSSHSSFSSLPWI